MNKYLIEFPEKTALNRQYYSISECTDWAECNEKVVSAATVWKYRAFNFPNKLLYGEYTRVGQGFNTIWKWKR